MRTIHELYRGIAQSIGMYAAAGAIGIAGCGGAQETETVPETVETAIEAEAPTAQPPDSPICFLSGLTERQRIAFLDADELGVTDMERFGEVFHVHVYEGTGDMYYIIHIPEARARTLVIDEGEGQYTFLDHNGDGYYNIRCIGVDMFILMQRMHENDQEEPRPCLGSVPYAALQR